ncbi:MAG: LytTR family DNA-binding domain-containing protein [Pseudomonadota bacterium]
MYLGLNVLAICVIISILRHGLPHVLGTAAPDLPRLADRLSDSARGAILRLEAEGHYVHIVTEQGAERVRLRLADAVREMEPVVGHFSHRSHWVAQSAIVGSGQEAGKRVLRLSNGDVVPVSRTFQPDLDAAGVL